MKSCPACNMENLDDANFCEYCGHKIAFSPIPGLPDGYTLKSSLNLKKGTYAIVANIIALICMVPVIVGVFVLFHFNPEITLDNMIYLLVQISILLASLVGFMLINLVLTIIICKRYGGGKRTLHVGLMIAVQFETALPRAAYILDYILSAIVPVLILTLFTIFFWSPAFYLSLCLVILNTLVSIPLFAFALKHKRSAYWNLEKGILNFYEK